MDVYIHEDTGCQQDSECDAAYSGDTFAWCEVEASNGTCHYQTYTEEPSCYGDWDCDDGDPTSTDTCSTEGCTYVIQANDPGGADAIVTLQNTCSSTNTSGHTIQTGTQEAILQCYNVDVLSNSPFWIDELVFSMGTYATDSITNLRVYIDGFQAGATLTSPTSVVGQIGTWTFTDVRRPVEGFSTICLMADTKSASQQNVGGWIGAPRLVTLRASDDNFAPSSVILGANEPFLAGEPLKVMRASLTLGSSYGPAVTQARSTTTELGRFHLSSTSNEGYSSQVYEMTFDINGSANALGQNRMLRIYKGTSTTPVIEIPVNGSEHLRVVVPTTALGPVTGSGFDFRVTLDTTGFPTGQHLLQLTVHEYRWTDSHSGDIVTNNDCEFVGVIAYGTAIYFN